MFSPLSFMGDFRLHLLFFMLCMLMLKILKRFSSCRTAQLWKANEQMTVMIIKLEIIHNFLVPGWFMLFSAVFLFNTFGL